MTTIKFLLGLVDGLSLWTGRLISWLIYPLIAIMTLEVIARYFFAAPQAWVPDISLWLYGILFMIGGAYTLLHKKHVAVDIIYLRFSPRGRAIVDLVFYLFVLLPILLFLLPDSIERVMYFQERGVVSHLTTWRPIIWPFFAVMPVAFFLLLFQAIANALATAVFVVRGEEP
jgi:TRAP-type mannitol/chloroaromatic compound transport system permease small subunit